MEEREASWGEAFSTAINRLTGVDSGGSAGAARMLFILLFAGGAAFAVYNYYNAELAPDGFLQEKYYEPTTPPDNSQADRTRLDKMLNDVRTASQTRSDSTTITVSMETLSKYPFRDPTMIPPPPPPGGEQIEVVEIVPEIDYAPVIDVKAILTVGKERVALMDLPDAGVVGMVVRAGDTFSMKKGRVVRITPEMVVVRWGGNTFNIRPRF